MEPRPITISAQCYSKFHDGYRSAKIASVWGRLGFATDFVLRFPFPPDLINRAC